VRETPDTQGWVTRVTPTKGLNTSGASKKRRSTWARRVLLGRSRGDSARVLDPCRADLLGRGFRRKARPLRHLAPPSAVVLDPSGRNAQCSVL